MQSGIILSTERSMKTFLYALAALPLLTGVAFAADKAPLSDKQMDQVTAGFDFFELDISNTSTVAVAVNFPAMTCPSCYLHVTSQWYGNPDPRLPMQVFGIFGPTPAPAPAP
jgi:hypothetical protein